jgi:hypothetical protein
VCLDRVIENFHCKHKICGSIAACSDFYAKKYRTPNTVFDRVWVSPPHSRRNIEYLILYIEHLILDNFNGVSF